MSRALPAGPVLTTLALLRLPQAAGRWLVASRLDPLPFADYWALAGIVTGIYLVTDAAGRIRWLGQASRGDELVARLGDHAGHPERRAVFATVRVLHLQDHTPLPALKAIEGRCADQLGLRGAMHPRVWPPATGWAHLVA